jgi:N-acetylmuramoyl-L-alanine amidase
MNFKKYILSIFCIVFAMTISAKQFTVVLDPGHGGKDPGAVGKKGQEKEINLNVALMVGKLINENHPDVKVVYTRKTDKYITLKDRPNIANDADGDLFISIHTNASESTKAYGAETFTLGLSKSQANFEVAKRENSVLLLEEGNQETYQGFDPTSPESYIMFEFMQSKYIDQSVEIAYYIQKEFIDIKRLDRGVRQAIFWVLHQVKMPSILVELGFITNPSEETFLLSAEGQKKMANSIYSGFEK